MPDRSLLWPSALLILACGAAGKIDYRGKLLGKLSQLHHAVSGEVYSVDARTLHIKNFNYDGEGPAAYFYVGSSKTPGSNGIRLRDERGMTNPLPKYRNQDITLSLPEGKSLQNIRWFSVWCDEFSVNFGDVRIQKGFEFPRPFKLGTLSGIHGVSSDPVVIVDAQTLLIPNFSYDGEAPDAKFWVGTGTRPTPQGIRVPDENGKENPLRRYDRKTIVLTLPGDLTVFDIGHFGVWCEAFTVDFGHVLIPTGLNVPPSLKMLGVSPQSKLNCEVLWDDLAFEVRWAVAGDSIVLQLVARLEGGEYMAFGVSGDPVHSKMVGGDVTVAWVDKDTLKGQAKDYYLDAKSQCSGVRGSCPDENIAEKTNNVRLLNAALVNGYSIVTFQRSLKAQDEYDKSFITNGSQPIIWAIGPLNARQEVSYHSLATKADILLDFGRPPKWNCPTPEGQSAPSSEPEAPVAPQTQRPPVQEITESVPDTRQQSSTRRESTRHKPSSNIATPAPATKVKPWDIPPIQCDEPEDGVFYAQMGPTGGKHGYPAITGHVGWGISWYINGLLIPEINVVRGRTYTFIVEGGLDPETPAKYHPFYITDDPVGGYEYKTPEERAQVQIFAGAVQNKRGEVRPTGVGRLCNWTPDQNGPTSDEFSSFGAYQRTLKLICDPGDPGIVQWTVAKDTPDTVYYQCYTHRYLGWKINVLDDCGEDAASSEVKPVYLRPPPQDDKLMDMDMDMETDSNAEASIQHVTKVLPESNPNGIQPSSNVQFVPEFHFYNKDTGEALDEATINQMNLEEEIKKLETQFYLNQPKEPQQEDAPRNPATAVSSDEQFLSFFHTPKPAQVLQENYPHSYSVMETPEDEPPAVPTHQFQLTHQTEKPAPLSTPKNRPMHYETTTLFDERFNQEFLKNYQQLQAEAAAKLKKHNQKFNQQFGKTTRLQYSVPRRPAVPHHAMTLQQRPMPPGVFRPPFLPPPPTKKPYAKRPAPSASQKVPAYSNINNIPNRPPTFIRPQKPPRIEPPQSQPVNFHQVLALQKLLTTSPPQEPKPAYASTVAFSEHVQHTTPSIFSRHPSPLAVNTGFNPESVKVEGGFKPILNTGIAPTFNFASERMDDDVMSADDAVDNIGVIDLTKEASTTDVKQALEQEKTAVTNNEATQETLNKTNEEVDIFKHLKPVMFEPMFVPSPPDNLVQKQPQKIRKKPINKYYTEGSLKHRNSHLEPYNANKNKYIKMRPRPNLIRRPLYPNNVMPPFKIPGRGGSPQFRYQQSDDSIEDTTDFDSLISGNETMEDDNGENILEVIEMDENNSNETSNSMEVVVLNTDDGSVFESQFKVQNSTEDEIAMADERTDFFMLPKRPGGVLTHDGKVVSAIAAPPSPPTAKFDISKLPQFVPFKGDLPPLDQSVPSSDLPQFKESKAVNSDLLPTAQLESDASKSKVVSRPRRSPDHVPGHVGTDHDHYDHEHHDHHHNHTDTMTTNSAIVSCVSLYVMIPVLSFLRFL